MVATQQAAVVGQATGAPTPPTNTTSAEADSLDSTALLATNVPSAPEVVPATAMDAGDTPLPATVPVLWLFGFKRALGPR